MESSRTQAQLRLATGFADGLARHERLVQTSRKWVAQSFFGTMLKQMRQSPFRSELFSGGRGGQAFESLYDQQLVEGMSRGAPDKLARSIVRKLEGSEAYRRNEIYLKRMREAARGPATSGQEIEG